MQSNTELVSKLDRIFLIATFLKDSSNFKMYESNLKYEDGTPSLGDYNLALTLSLIDSYKSKKINEKQLKDLFLYFEDNLNINDNSIFYNFICTYFLEALWNFTEKNSEQYIEHFKDYLLNYMGPKTRQFFNHPF